MRALPILIAIALAVMLAPSALQALHRSGHLQPNYRGRPLPCPFGLLIAVAALLALIPVMLIERLAHASILYPRLLPVALYALGVTLLGAIDDMLGSAPALPGDPPAFSPHGGPAAAAPAPALPGDPPAFSQHSGPAAAAPAPRGWRGHGGALLRGQPSTGVLKAAGSLGLALLATNLLHLSLGRWLLASAVLLLATNALNLLDLRPGRALKAFVLLGAGLTIGAGDMRSLLTLGLFAGPALVAGAYDLRERAMLGDAGANLLGALAGLWLVLSLGPTGQLIALASLLALTVYGELRSISALLERVALLRALDRWGRPSRSPAADR